MTKIKEAIRGYADSDPPAENTHFMLNVSLDNIRAIDKLLASRAFYIAVLCAAFEFLRQASISEISVFGVKFTEYGLIERAIPSLVSYLYLSCFTLLASRGLVEELFNTLIKYIFPKLSENELALYLRPAHFIKTYGIVVRNSHGWMRILLNIFSKAIPFFVALSLPVFLSYSFFWLFRKYGIDFVTIFSGFLSTAFVAQAFFVGVSASRAIGVKTKQPNAKAS